MLEVGLEVVSVWKRRERESSRLGRAEVAGLPKLWSIRTLSTAITDSDLNRLTVENVMAHEIVDLALGMAELCCSEGLGVFGSHGSSAHGAGFTLSEWRKIH